ncbi:ABC transporter substrate-binding protein [Cohnella abietis]|uniref:Sugar ABC transporter substrate-binding protein n=1 Tax=Cohnella abietis TaxID=2507935 RepID=A0A3T1CZ90_9BACL|nr:ABC transporter substrate-binding protein [Cohnella abietis]BBI31173.1 sugar ABC transporter substrate-binding protein [Cohnella abietis]
MTKKGKVSTLSLAVLMATSLSLAACSNNANNGGDNSAAPSSPATSSQSNSTTEATPAVKDLQPYEVSIYMPGSPQKDQSAVEQNIAELLKDKVPNTTVKLNYVDWGAYQQKTNLMLQTGEPMDLVFAPEWYQFFSNAVKGAFLALNDDGLPQGNLLEQYGQGIKSVIDPLYLEAPIVDSKLYAIPTNKEIAQGRGFAFRKDIIEKYGFDVSGVKELKDIEPFLQTIKEKEPNIYPVYANKQDSAADWQPDYGYQPLFSNGAFINRNGDANKVISTTDAGYAAKELEGYKLLNEWYKKGYVNKTAATTQEKIADVEAAGKIWWVPTTTAPGRAEAQRIKNTSGQGPEFWDWIVVNSQNPLVTTPMATGSQFAIARASKDPVRAMMVLNELYVNKDLLNTVVFGLEGKHYNKVSDNKISLIPDSGYSPGNGWIIGNQLNNYLLDNEKDDKYEEYVTFNKTAERSPLLGFNFNPDPVKTQVAAFNTIWDEYKDILRTGAVDPGPIVQKRNGKLEKAGLQQIADEVQKQLDAWKVANGK